jgi:bleomycin hydrolase
MLFRLCSAPLLALPLLAQTLTPDRLAALEASCPQDAAFRALHHALVQEDGRKLALDWERINAMDGHFTRQIPDEPVANQKSSGRCWMFSGLNLFRRAGAKRLGCENLEYSQAYLFFYDKLEKTNLYLDAIAACRNLPATDRRVEHLLAGPVPEGGNWQGFADLVRKYGVVPKDAMPETFSSSTSAPMNQVLDLRLKAAGVRIRGARDEAAVAAEKAQALKDVYRILALHLGVPPARFTWRYEGKDHKLTEARTWTPLEFAKATFSNDLDGFVALYSVPTLPFGRKYAIDLDRAVLEREDMTFVNAPLVVLKDAARQCILEDQPVWFGADVSQDMAGDQALMMADVRDFASLYGMDFSQDRKALFETRRSVPNHNMVFTGIDLKDGKPVKWLVENSWGDARGKKGYYTMTDTWFDRFVQVVVVPKAKVPKDLLAAFGTQAEVLPPWDPMMMALQAD